MALPVSYQANLEMAATFWRPGTRKATIIQFSRLSCAVRAVRFRSSISFDAIYGANISCGRSAMLR
jgi:hypothetical protein